MYLSKHALKGYDSQGKEVNSKSVVLPTYDFWGHVTWSPARISVVLFRVDSCYSQIGDAEVPFFIQD